LQLETTAPFRKWAKSLQPSDQKKVLSALTDAAKVFGNPHAHRGAGIRKLRASIMECRAGLHLRMVFLAESDKLIFVAGGNHDEIRRFLKTV
jgi:hypothetical protein